MPINYSNLTPSYYGAGKAIRSVGSKAKSVWDSVPTQVKSTVGTVGKVANAVAMPQKAVVNTITSPKPGLNAFARGLTGNQMATTPQMSVEVKKPVVMPKVIQGSGMTGQYASNPTNYVPPKVTPPPTNMNDWLSGTKALQARTDQFYNSSEAKRKALAQKQYDDAVALQNEMFANANNDLRGEIPRLDERMSKFETGVRDNMAQADVIGAENKEQAKTYTGDAQRTAMQNKRQTDAQREKQYAALGTIDSYGTGSFTQGNANADTEFNRGTQQRYDSLAQNLTEIDRKVASYKTEALALIDTEKAKYEEQVREINRQLRDNDVARRGAIAQAYNTTQEAINNISDQYEGLRLTAEKDKLTFQQEMDKLAAENTMPTVSDWFKQTGQPQTQEDFDFIYRNPTAATALQKMIGGSGTKQTETGMKFSLAAQTAQQALDSLQSGLANTGKGQAISSAWGKFSGSQSPSQTDYETKLAAARSVALNALSGAAVSPSEYKRLKDMIPNITDEPQIAEQKLTSFVQIMNMYGQGMNQTSTQLTQDQIQQILAGMPQS